MATNSWSLIILIIRGSSSEKTNLLFNLISQQHGINREAARISALSSRKNDKHGYLTGKEILLSNHRQIIEQAKFADSFLGKTFEEETEKQVGALKSLELSNEKDQLKQIEGVLPQNLMNNLIYVK